MSNTYYFCRNCLFGDNCEKKGLCEHYAPINEMSDDDLYAEVEQSRDEYRSAWFQYIEKFND